MAVESPWIIASEDPPEEDRPYLIYWENENGFRGYSTGQFEDGEWRFIAHWLGLGSLKHWVIAYMPIVYCRATDEQLDQAKIRIKTIRQIYLGDEENEVASLRNAVQAQEIIRLSRRGW